MSCVVCKHGELSTGATRVSLAHDGTVLVFEGVPANVCENCGETYVSGVVADKLQGELESARQRNVTLERRTYPAAEGNR
jgi:YgiT-type zinc finger domain-containing protein